MNGSQLTVVVAGVEPLAVLSRQDNLTLALDELNTQSHSNVECNVAMHQPGSGIVSGVGDDEPAVGW